MKRIMCVLTFIISSLLLMPVMPAMAGVNDFHFSDFTGDYYLSKDDAGISHLKVVESVTAVFPDFDQNKGICRQIAFTNQNGKNVTLPNLTRANLKLTRNGVSEPIYSIEKEGGYYNVCTGTEEYLRGEQKYVFEYEFTKVVTEFNENGKEYQELYWDTNGSGSQQKFDKVTARLHFEDLDAWTGESWCYVGKYGDKGEGRCKISKIDDGVVFSSENLARFENLTFDTELKPGSFVVPEPEKNYAYVWLIIALAALCVLWVAYKFWKYLKTSEKRNYYKGLFVKPEYQPNPKFRLTEMAEIYLGKKKDAKVAMLLEMVVQKKIELIKGEKKKEWSILVKEDLDDEYGDLLAILNGGSKPAKGDTIEVKRHSATSKLVALKSAMNAKIVGALKKDGLVEDKYHVGDSTKRGFGNIIASTIIAVPIIAMFGLFLLGLMSDWLNLDGTYGGEMVFAEYFYWVALALITVTVIISVFLNDRTQELAKHTMKGLEASRYMEGLELYIRMAEADRLKFLQSVDGADVSSKGIVKLYEKLLPYAAVFGLEESWLKEMKEYCEVNEIEEPNYLLTGIAASEITRHLHNAASYATTSTVMSSSGGGSSSGFSGVGGGGFSGGGGGGGGFGGR